MSNQEDIINKLKDAFDSVLPSAGDAGYPKEALPIGTLVRSIRLDKLGTIVDAFYGELDEDNQKIIIYTILLFPKTNILAKKSKTSEQFYLTNEYEYEIIGYLMMKPIDIKKLSKIMGGGLLL